MQSLGARLKVWRESIALTQAEASAALGLPGSTYQNYERDVRAPNTEGWESFVRAGINANWLLTGEGPMLLANLSDKRENGYIVDEEREERMSEAVDLVDFVLGSQKRKWPPGKKYELIKAVSDLLDDREETKDRVLRLIKSAA